MDYALNNKRRVIRLVLQWAAMYGDLLQEDDVAMAFLEVCVWGSFNLIFNFKKILKRTKEKSF